MMPPLPKGLKPQRSLLASPKGRRGSLLRAPTGRGDGKGKGKGLLVAPRSQRSHSLVSPSTRYGTGKLPWRTGPQRVVSAHFDEAGDVGRVHLPGKVDEAPKRIDYSTLQQLSEHTLKPRGGVKRRPRGLSSPSVLLDGRGPRSTPSFKTSTSSSRSTGRMSRRSTTIAPRRPRGTGTVTSVFDDTPQHVVGAPRSGGPLGHRGTGTRPTGSSSSSPRTMLPMPPPKGSSTKGRIAPPKTVGKGTVDRAFTSVRRGRSVSSTSVRPTTKTGTVTPGPKRTGGTGTTRTVGSRVQRRLSAPVGPPSKTFSTSSRPAPPKAPPFKAPPPPPKAPLPGRPPAPKGTAPTPDIVVKGPRRGSTPPPAPPMPEGKAPKGTPPKTTGTRTRSSSVPVPTTLGTSSLGGPKAPKSTGRKPPVPTPIPSFQGARMEMEEIRRRRLEKNLEITLGHEVSLAPPPPTLGPEGPRPRSFTTGGMTPITARTERTLLAEAKRTGTLPKGLVNTTPPPTTDTGTTSKPTRARSGSAPPKLGGKAPTTKAPTSSKPTATAKAKAPTTTPKTGSKGDTKEAPKKRGKMSPLDRVRNPPEHTTQEVNRAQSLLRREKIDWSSPEESIARHPDARVQEAMIVVLEDKGSTDTLTGTEEKVLEELYKEQDRRGGPGGRKRTPWTKKKAKRLELLRKKSSPTPAERRERAGLEREAREAKAEKAQANPVERLATLRAKSKLTPAEHRELHALLAKTDDDGDEPPAAVAKQAKQMAKKAAAELEKLPVDDDEEPPDADDLEPLFAKALHLKQLRTAASPTPKMLRTRHRLEREMKEELAELDVEVPSLQRLLGLSSGGTGSGGKLTPPTTGKLVSTQQMSLLTAGGPAPTGTSTTTGTTSSGTTAPDGTTGAPSPTGKKGKGRGRAGTPSFGKRLTSSLSKSFRPGRRKGTATGTSQTHVGSTGTGTTGTSSSTSSSGSKGPFGWFRRGKTVSMSDDGAQIVLTDAEARKPKTQRERLQAKALKRRSKTDRDKDAQARRKQRQRMREKRVERAQQNAQRRQRDEARRKAREATLDAPSVTTGKRGSSGALRSLGTKALSKLGERELMALLRDMADQHGEGAELLRLVGEILDDRDRLRRMREL